MTVLLIYRSQYFIADDLINIPMIRYSQFLQIYFDGTKFPRYFTNADYREQVF